ncbi:MAG: ExeM/NucH family extracellular endonuclease [Pseudomonadota bacterium]
MLGSSRNRFTLLALCAALSACGGGGAEAPVATTPIVPPPAAPVAPPFAMPACPAPTLVVYNINAVQGSGALSPLVGKTIAVQGVVTGDFQASTKLKGFFMQQAEADNDPKTSEGIFVYAPDNPVQVALGQVVQVSGTVEEFKSGTTDPERSTQIGQVTKIEICGAGPVIAATTVALPFVNAADFEAVEGMLITIPQTLTVADTANLGRFGELSLVAGGRMFTPYSHPTITDPAKVIDLNAHSQILLDDGSTASNPSPIPHLSATGTDGTRRTGDTIAGLRGILTWGFDTWRVHPLAAVPFVATNPRPATPPAVGGTLRGGSMNVLNYFTQLGSRGANTALELTRQRDKIVAAVEGLNADVLGLMEIQNDPTTTIGNLVAAVNAKMGANTYKYIISSPGTDEIKVAIIYKPARVSPIGNPKVPTDTDFIVNGGFRPPMAQRFAANDNHGNFWMVVNHLKSKGGCPSGATNVDAEYGQGCWNASRVRQANALTRWVASLVSVSGEKDVLMVGDYNSYINEDPIKAIEAAGYENLIKRLPPAARYSYVFDGQSGSLDHAIVSSAFSGQINGVTEWHVNADEPSVFDYNTEFRTDDRYAATPYRAADHDSLLVGLTLNPDAIVNEPILAATFPTTGQSGSAVTIADLNAMPSVSATSSTLTIDWGDGSAVQTLATTATSAQHTFAAAGTFALRLNLADSTGASIALTGSITVSAPPPPPAAVNLFFSEYLEGSANNKALEIYNPGGAPVDLTGYSVKLFANGAIIPTATQVLTGIIQPGATLTLINSGMTPALSAAVTGTKLVSGATNFNGDDAVTLEKDGVVIDAIGQVGYDPGVEWITGSVSTLNMTIRRKAGITGGSLPAARPANWDVSAEWVAFPIDTVNGLGTR